MVDVPVDRFEQLVADALDALPPELGRMMRNVAVVVEEDSEGGNLFGLYQGVPLTARDQWYSGVLPDRISIYRVPICRVRVFTLKVARPKMPSALNTTTSPVTTPRITTMSESLE